MSEKHAFDARPIVVDMVGFRHSDETHEKLAESRMADLSHRLCHEKQPGGILFPFIHENYAHRIALEEIEFTLRSLDPFRDSNVMTSCWKSSSEPG